MQHTVGLMLAAGSGRRFDPTGKQNKLLHNLDSGLPVAVQTAQNLLSAVSKVIAVVRCPKVGQRLTQAGCDVHLLSQADSGIGDSLAFGISHVTDHAHSVLVALGDMPFVQSDTIRTLVEVMQFGAEIVQPVYQQCPGHPVGFSRRHFSALMRLTGDVGARHLLRDLAVHQVNVDDAGILRDIDFLTDLDSP